MSEKTVHIVFQVLNFIFQTASDDYALTADEKLILIALAKHKGFKGIYPSVATLARELKRSDSAVRRTLSKLQKKQLILIDYNPGHSSHYHLLIPHHLSTTPSVYAGGTMELPLAPTLGHPLRGRQDTPSVDARQSIQSNNQKEIKQRGRKSRATPLTDDFLISSETIAICKDLGLSEDEANDELESFFLFYQGNGAENADWNKVLQLWFKRSVRYSEKGGSKPKKPDEVKSTVPWRNPDHAPRNNEPVSISKLIRQGGQINGLGGERKAKA